MAICTLVGVLVHTGLTRCATFLHVCRGYCDIIPIIDEDTWLISDSHTSPGSLFVPAPTDILPSQGFSKAAVAIGLFLMSVSASLPPPGASPFLGADHLSLAVTD